MASDRDILSSDVKPSNYAISLFDLKAGEPWTYQGTCSIDLEIKKSTSSISLNTHELKVHSAEVSFEAGKSASSLKASKTEYDVKNQRCTFSFDQELPQSPKAVLTISFEGTMNNHMAGFYRSAYKPTVEASKGVAKDAENHYMFSTQFESSDARRAIPCFDEPNLKATFDFEMEIPDDLVALSNMPERETRKSAKEGHKIVSFERTPVSEMTRCTWDSKTDAASERASVSGNNVAAMASVHVTASRSAALLEIKTDVYVAHEYLPPGMGIRRLRVHRGLHQAEVQRQEPARAGVHHTRAEGSRQAGSGERASGGRLLLRGKQAHHTRNEVVAGSASAVNETSGV